MTDIAQPHDRFLKALLSNPETAGTLLRERLPKEIADCLSPEPPELVEGSFVDEELRAHLTDRLFQVRTINGKVALLYVLIEHKSQPDRKIAWQLYKYQNEALKQWDRENPDWELLPAIVPFVFYHGEVEWRIPNEFLALVDAEEGWHPYLLNFQYSYFDLGNIPDRLLSRQLKLRAWLLLAKYATRDDQQAGVKELLVESLVAVSLEDFRFQIRYMVETFRSYDEQVLREIIRRVHPEEEQAMMSQFAQEQFAKGETRGRQEGLWEGERKGRQEGLWEGERKGRQEGLLEGEARLLLRQLQRRFGTVPEWVRVKVTSANAEALEAWGERVIDADTIETIFQ